MMRVTKVILGGDEERRQEKHGGTVSDRSDAAVCLSERSAGRIPRMRRKLLLLAVAVGALSNAGCLVNAYSSDPNIRTSQLLNQSEDLRQVGEEWRRIWFTDQPSHMTPNRIHGGIQ